MQCYFVSGDTDYLLIIHVKDMNHYNELARRVFANEPNIKWSSSITPIIRKYLINDIQSLLGFSSI
jgi:DNA-binding Lrp family transcriptional regulator